MNQPDKAEEIFTALEDSLRDRAKHGPGAAVAASPDPPEVLNNLGVALARTGKIPFAEADFRRATEMDPDEDDYPFNLGLIALRAGNFSTAADSFREASEREPDNPEDRAFLIFSLEKAGKKSEADEEREAAAEALGPNALPAIPVIDAKGEALGRLERLKTDLDIAPLRLEIESSPAAVSSATTVASGAGSTGSPASRVVIETPATRIRRGRQELSMGHLDVAETEFRAALASDPANAAAHRALADVAKRRGNLDEAVKQLQASLDARDSAVVRTTLAKIYLDQKKIDLARTELERVLKLAPTYTEAKVLLEHLQNSRPGGGTY
jgi:Tfp pilus assembly protein PilF